MRALKVLVVVMGVMLVGGTAALIIAIIDKASHRAASTTTALAPSRGFERATVALPEGAKVVSTEIVGDRLLLRAALAEGGEQLILLDLRNGERLGMVEVRVGGQRP